MGVGFKGFGSWRLRFGFQVYGLKGVRVLGVRGWGRLLRLEDSTFRASGYNADKGL